MNYVYFDTETIPDQSDDAIEKAAKSVNVPGNYKKQETIDAYIEEQKHIAHAKTALDGFTGHVCAIGWERDGHMQSGIVRDLQDEKECIKTFFSDLPRHECTLVGHNIGGFDIKFITRRALVLGIQLPLPNIWPRDVKPWGDEIFDTMACLGQNKYVSLDTLCNLFGIEGKGDVNGSMVAHLWETKDFDTIDAYVRDDVTKHRLIHERFLSVNW